MKPGRSAAGVMAGVALVLCSNALHAEEYTFNIAETEKKPYHLGGHVEFRPALSGLDRDAALYHLRFYDRDEGKTAAEYRAALQVEGDVARGPAKLFARITAGYQDADADSKLAVTAYEVFLTLRPAAGFSLDVGKKALKWGKGYAWNPVSFVDRPKNPDEPDLNLEGFVLAAADYTLSLSGPLQTLSITPVLVPVTEHVNSDFGAADHLDVAGKVYLLLYDTDIDFLFLAGGSRTSRFGLDFSRNLTTNLEIHGEYARINDYKHGIIARDGGARQAVADASNWLLGFRYLTGTDTTYILEFFRNGAGYTEQEMKDFFSLVHSAYDLYLSSGSDTLLQKAEGVAESYGRPNAGRSYLYLRVSQKEPFDMLYWTPAVTAIVNAQDRSFSISPEIAYTGITNVELRLKGTVLGGDRFSEYGEKQSNVRIELLARYYF